MNAIKKLEQAALDAHKAGLGWKDFWQQHGKEVIKAEPFNRVKSRRLVNRLLALVTSGDTCGMSTISPTQWESDDALDT